MNSLPAARLEWQQVATYLAARVLPALASMALTFLCIHALSPEEYGRYSLTLLPASIGAGLVGGLSGQAMLRYGHQLSAAGLRRGLVAFPLWAAAAICPLVLGYLAWSVGLGAASVVATALVPAVALMDTRRNFFVARAQAGSVFRLDALRAISALIAVVLLLRLLGPDASAPLLAQLGSVAVCLLLVRARASEPTAHGSREIDRRYLRYGLWFAGWMAVVGAFSLAERALVESVSGLAASGRYAAQADIVNAVFAAGGGALASSMMPSYLALVHPTVSREAHGPTFGRLLRVGIAGTLATAVLCVAAGYTLAASGAGRIAESLTSDATTALMLVAAGMVWTAAGFVQKPLELHGQTRLTFVAVTMSLLLFMLIGDAFATRWGAPGVAGAKLLAGLCFVGVAVWFARRSTP